MCNACNIARKAYYKAAEPLWEAYLEARKPFLEVYEVEAQKHFMEDKVLYRAYLKAQNPVWRVYEDAEKPLYEALIEVLENCKDHV